MEKTKFYYRVIRDDIKYQLETRIPFWTNQPRIIDSFRCLECGVTMPTEGLMLHHCMNVHSPPASFEKREVNLELIV